MSLTVASFILDAFNECIDFLLLFFFTLNFEGFKYSRVNFVVVILCILSLYSLIVVISVVYPVYYPVAYPNSKYRRNANEYSEK